MADEHLNAEERQWVREGMARTQKCRGLVWSILSSAVKWVAAWAVAGLVVSSLVGLAVLISGDSAWITRLLSLAP